MVCWEVLWRLGLRVWGSQQAWLSKSWLSLRSASIVDRCLWCTQRAPAPGVLPSHSGSCCVAWHVALENTFWRLEDGWGKSACFKQIPSLKGGGWEVCSSDHWLVMKLDLKSSCRLGWKGAVTNVWPSVMVNSASSGVLLLFICFPLWKILLISNRRKAGACEDDQERAVGFGVLLNYALWNDAEWSLA